jgi:HEAT repeat protein
MDLMWDGLDEIPWGTLRHNYGTAEDIPGLLRGCASSDAAVAVQAATELDNNLHHQGGWVCPAASAALPFLTRLASDLRVTVRAEVIGSVGSLAQTAAEVDPRRVDQAWPRALESAVPALLALLGDGDPRVRHAAARLSGVRGLGPDLVLPALRARLREEPDRVIRCDLTVALASAAAGSPQSGEVIGELTEAAGGGGDVQVRFAAVRGLARLGEPVYDHVGLLVSATAQDDATWNRSEWLSGHPAAPVTTAGSLLIGSPLDAVAYAEGMSRHGSAAQRAAVLGSVGTLLQQWRALPGSVLPYLAGELQAPSADVRFRAAFLLACLGRPAASYAGQVAALTTDHSRTSARSDQRVSDAAVWAMLRFGDPRGVAGLRDRLTGDRLGFTASEAHYPASPGFWFAMPSIGQAVRLAGPGAGLLDPVVRRLHRSRVAGSQSLTSVLCKTLEDYGPGAAAAVPELIQVLKNSDPVRFPGPAAASALGQVGEGAGAAAAELRRHAAAGSGAAEWAALRVSGQSALPLLLGELDKSPRPTRTSMPRLGDFGPLAAAAEPRLREILGSHRESWVPTEAAYALWRITGDSDTAVRALTWIIPHLLDGWCTPAAVLALNHLASIAQSTPDVTAVARFVLASPLRLANSGGWRAFTDDEQVQAAATEYLTRTGQDT